MTVTTTYPQVQRTARRPGRCPACGQPTVRTRTFTATVSPFNVGPDGRPRTRDQVAADLARRAAAWAPDPGDFTHLACMAGPAPEPEPGPYRRPPAARRAGMAVADAATAAATAITLLGLATSTLTIEHDSVQDPPVLVRPGWRTEPAEYLAWCRALGVERVRAEYRPHSTALHAAALYVGLSWRLGGDLPRPAVGPRLPGVHVPEVLRSGGRVTGALITTDQLAAAIHALNLPTEVATDA